MSVPGSWVLENPKAQRNLAMGHSRIDDLPSKRLQPKFKPVDQAEDAEDVEESTSRAEVARQRTLIESQAQQIKDSEGELIKAKKKNLKLMVENNDHLEEVITAADENKKLHREVERLKLELENNTISTLNSNMTVVEDNRLRPKYTQAAQNEVGIGPRLLPSADQSRSHRVRQKRGFDHDGESEADDNASKRARLQ